MRAIEQPATLHKHRGEYVFPRHFDAWVRNPARETMMPMSTITDDEIITLESLVRRERAATNYHTTRELALLQGIERAIKALRNERERSSRARMILTMVWQSRKLLAGDLWIVTNREMDDLACQLVEMYFGGPYDPQHNPQRRAGDADPNTEH